MKRTVVLFALASAVCTMPVHAKTPAQLVAAFQNVLPAGQKAQMAWVQKENTKRCIYVVDSDTGIIRRLTGDTMDAKDPHITDDGTRVVFLDVNKRELRVVNWNGIGGKVVYTGIGALEDYYQNPADKSEWAVTYGPFARINIDTKQRMTLPGSPGDDGVRMSPDGKYYASDNGGGWGITDVANGQVTRFCSGGCIVNISPDATYRISVQISGHKAINVCTRPGGTGTAYPNWNITSSIFAAYGSGSGFESTRWVAPDYFTFNVSGLKQGPFLLKLSDPTKYVAVQDTLGANMDQGFMSSSISARIFTRTSTGILRGDARSARTAKRNLDGARCETYLPDGRRLGLTGPRANNVNSRKVHGVVVHRIQGETAIVRTVHVP